MWLLKAELLYLAKKNQQKKKKQKQKKDLCQIKMPFAASLL